MINEDTLKRSIKLGQVPTDFTWHLHSMDCTNLHRLGIGGGPVFMKELVGYPVHVDDRYPRWVKMKPELLSHDDAEYTINPGGMVEFGVYMTRKGKSLHEQLQLELHSVQKNDLLPEDFHWYLNPVTFHNLTKENHGVFDAVLNCPHPDDMTYCLLGYRVRNDPDAPTGTAADIIRRSIELSNNDRDWYLMWARKWKCDRKEAKRALLLYVYGPQSEAEKTIIKIHYDNIAVGGKEVKAMNVVNKFTVDAEAPPMWNSFTGKAKDLLDRVSSHDLQQAQKVANNSHRELREKLPVYMDAVYKAIKEHRHLDAMKHLLNLQQQVTITAGHVQHYEAKRERAR